MPRNVTEIQARLIALGYLAPVDANGDTNADGKFGEHSLDAYNHFRASIGKGPVVQASMAELNADLFPEEQPAPPPKPVRKPGLFDVLAQIPSLIDLLKGKPMTTDQIGGVVRALLTFLAGIAVAKGWLDNATALTIVGALVTLVTAGWSMFTNRPSKLGK
jgi:hypothetical protein